MAPGARLADREFAFRPVEPGDPLENLLADIWERCLGRRPEDVHASFSSLGGTPALMRRMIEEVERAVATPLDSARIAADTTIEALASCLRRPTATVGRPERPAYFVRNPRGTAPPVFFLHGDYRGGGLYCVTLAARLGREQPLYAIAPLGVDGGPLPPDIAAMATSHVQALRTLRPRGPYRLGGHCAGAVIAFEMARQLRAAGEDIEALVLVAPLLGPAQFGSLARLLAASGLLRARMRAEATLRRYVHRIAWLRSQPPGTRLALLSDRLTLPVRGRRGRDRAWPGGATRGGEPPPVADPREDLWRAYGDAMWAYCPPPYDGPVTVLRPVGEGGAGAARMARAWAKVAPRVELRLIPGTHLACITTHVDALAAQMKACLANVGAPGPRVEEQ